MALVAAEGDSEDFYKPGRGIIDGQDFQKGTGVFSLTNQGEISAVFYIDGY